MVALPPLQYSAVVGLLLSEGWLVFASNKSKNARLGFKQSYSHYEYVWFTFLYYPITVIVCLFIKNT